MHIIDGNPSGIPLLEIYNDRLKSRVADVSSVYLRDLAIWGVFVVAKIGEPYRSKAGFRELWNFLQEYNERVNESHLLRHLETIDHDWGQVV
jgi:hypothetical protein